MGGLFTCPCSHTSGLSWGLMGRSMSEQTYHQEGSPNHAFERSGHDSVVARARCCSYCAARALPASPAGRSTRTLDVPGKVLRHAHRKSSRVEIPCPFRELIAWAWGETPPVHTNAVNLIIHLFAVPLFVAGHIPPYASAMFISWWLAGLGLLSIIVSVGLQGFGHSLEQRKVPLFSGRRDFRTPTLCGAILQLLAPSLFRKVVCQLKWIRRWPGCLTTRSSGRGRDKVPPSNVGVRAAQRDRYAA